MTDVIVNKHIDINADVTNAWKTKTCGSCRYQERAPRDPRKPIDLTEPVVLLCRHSPPQIVFAIGQSPGNPQPMPVPLGSMFAMITGDFPACSFYSPNLNS